MHTCFAKRWRKEVRQSINEALPFSEMEDKLKMSADEPDDGTEPIEERLRALIAEHETKLMEIADLVAHVRHEINNPLTGVLGQAQLLLREELSPRVRKRIETIEQLATRIRDTVAQLRDVQRPQNKR